MRSFVDTAVRLSRSTFARNVALVASGTAGAQAIAMVFAPLITRLYGPEAYGLLGTFLAMVGMVAPVSALTYPIAIVLPSNDADARGLIRLALTLSLVVAALAFGIFSIAGDAILSSLGAGELSSFALLIPTVLLFSAWSQIAQQWLIRHQAFRTTARIAVFQALLLNGTKTLGGLVHPVAAVLIALQTTGVALNALLLGRASRLVGKGEKPKAKDQQGAGSVALAFRYKDFPLYRAPQVFINAASQSLPVLMLASLFGPTAAGFYALARTVIGLPSGLVAESVGTVFYPEIAARKRQGLSCFRAVFSASAVLAAVGVVPFGVVVAFGPWLFGLVFGAEWVVAGEYARWLAVMYFFNFVNRPSVAAIPVLGLQRGLLIYELFSTGTKVLALYIGLAIYGSDRLAVALFGIVGAGAYIALIVGVLLGARNFESEIHHAQQTS